MRLAERLAAAGIALDFGDPAGEARACRNACALFDFSFMFRARVSGPGALGLVQLLTPRPLADLLPGRIRYALREDAAGRVVSDLTVWRIDGESYDVFSGREEEGSALAASADGDACVQDLSADTAVLAIQGPDSLRALGALAPADRLAAIPYFGHAAIALGGSECRVGRLGYTGERGFELVLPGALRRPLWEEFARLARPAGFAAADILRIEAGFLLYANELAFPVTAAELGLSRFGGAGPAPPRLRLVAFRGDADAPPRLPEPAVSGALPPRAGEILVSSACWSPLARSVLGLGYVAAAEAGPALVDPEGRYRAMRLATLPFFDPRKRVPRGPWKGGEGLSRDRQRA